MITLSYSTSLAIVFALCSLFSFLIGMMHFALENKYWAGNWGLLCTVTGLLSLLILIMRLGAWVFN